MKHSNQLDTHTCFVLLESPECFAVFFWCSSEVKVLLSGWLIKTRPGEILRVGLSQTPGDSSAMIRTSECKTFPRNSKKGSWPFGYQLTLWLFKWDQRNGHVVCTEVNKMVVVGAEGKWLVFCFQRRLRLDRIKLFYYLPALFVIRT